MPARESILTKLFPEPGTIAVDDAYGDVRFGAPPTGRPFTIVNMIATVDGQGRLGADTAELGGEVDKRLFVKLREQVDCVLAGTRTIQSEQYKGPASKQQTRSARKARGLRERPLFSTISRSGSLPWSAPVFQDEGIECVVFSAAELAVGQARAKITQVHETEPSAVARVLSERFGVRCLLLEGGPALNAVFFAAGLVDELFLTVAPLLAGGSDPFPIVSGDLGPGAGLQLRGAMLDHEQYLYLRYGIGGADD